MAWLNFVLMIVWLTVGVTVLTWQSFGGQAPANMPWLSNPWIGYGSLILGGYNLLKVLLYRAMRRQKDYRNQVTVRRPRHPELQEYNPAFDFERPEQRPQRPADPSAN